MAQIVQALRADDAAAREAAEAKLRDQNWITPQDLRIAIDEAAGSFPPSSDVWDRGSVALMLFVADHMRPEFVSSIAKQYARYDSGAKHYALVALARAGTDDAISLALDLYQAGRAETVTKASPFQDLQYSLAGGAVLFPRLLEMTAGSEDHEDALHLLFAFVAAQRLTPEQKAACAPFAIGSANRRLNEMRQFEGTAASRLWFLQEAVSSARSELALVLDTLGYFDCASSLEVLRRALVTADPWPKLFAALSLISRGGIVAAGELEDLAKWSETRRVLYDRLLDLGRSSLFPPRWRTKEALAESDLVRWLVFPTELGRPPDEIELMARVPVTSEEGAAEYFVYRFRTLEPHWSAKNGWMAGVAGPYLVAEPLPKGGASGCFSQFTAWEELSAEQHARQIIFGE